MPTPPQIPTLPADTDPRIKAAFDALRRYFADAEKEGGVVTATAGSTAIATAIATIPPSSTGGIQPVSGASLPPPSGLQAGFMVGGIYLVWNLYLPGGVGYVDILRAEIDDLPSAVSIGQSSSSSYSDRVGDPVVGVTYYYWIKFYGTDGTPGPINATAGTVASTEISISADSIRSGELSGVPVRTFDVASGKESILSGGDLVFYKGGTAYKYLKQIKTGSGLSGVAVDLYDLDNAPEVIVSLRDLTSYMKTHPTLGDISNQNQRWEVRLDDSGVAMVSAGRYRFTPIAKLTLATASGTTAINAPFSGSGNISSIGNGTYLSPANTTTITVSGTVNSTRGTGIAPNYYHRQCVATLNYRVAGSGSGYLTVSAATLSHGSDLTADSFLVTKTGLTANTYEYYLTFAWSEPGTTFASGSGGGSWSRVTDNVSGVGATADTGTNATSSTVTVNKAITLNNYSLPAGGWVYDNDSGNAVNYSAPWNFTLTRSNATSGYSGDANVFGPSVNDTLSAPGTTLSKSGTGVWSGTSFVKTKAFSSTAYANYYASNNRASITYGTPAATVKRKLWVEQTNSNIAANVVNIIQATHQLASATILDDTGMVNWIAIA